MRFAALLDKADPEFAAFALLFASRRSNDDAEMTPPGSPFSNRNTDDGGAEIYIYPMLMSSRKKFLWDWNSRFIIAGFLWVDGKDLGRLDCCNDVGRLFCCFGGIALGGYDAWFSYPVTCLKVIVRPMIDMVILVW